MPPEAALISDIHISLYMRLEAERLSVHNNGYTWWENTQGIRTERPCETLSDCETLVKDQNHYFFNLIDTNLKFQIFQSADSISPVLLSESLCCNSVT